MLPVRDPRCEMANMDQIEMVLLERPWQLCIVDLELDIRGDPVLLVVHYGGVVGGTNHDGWIGLRSVPMMCAEG